VYTAFFFFDASHGLAATSEPKIRYISDASQGQWAIATIPAGFTVVRQIRFIQGTLYAADDGPDILISNDSGKTWNYSGLGLSNTNDVYADASGNIRALTDPMKSFARIDTMDCVAVGGGSLFTSSDGGLNWITSVTGIDPLSIGAFADPCHHVFICPSTYGTAALRSTDSGKTWQDVLTGAGPYPEYIDGASTTCYLNDTGGMFRSIDDGATWTSITTVNMGPHFPMFVWGPMGEQVVMSYEFFVIRGNNDTDTLLEPWMTTTGGDGNLHSAVAMTDSNGAPLMQEDTMNVPFRVVSTCNSFLIPIALEADVPGLSLEATLTNNSGGDVTLLGSDSLYFPQPVLNQRYVQDTMWLAYDPHHLVDTATLTFYDQWNCSDWSETRTVILTSIPSATITPPPTLAGICQPVSGAAFVKLDSCSTLIIDSVQIPPALLSRLSLTKLLPDTMRIGTNDSLFFTFNPSDTVATLLDSIRIFAHYYPSTGLDSTLNFFNFNLYLDGDSDFSFFEQTIPLNLVALPNLPWKLYPSAPDSAAPGTDVTYNIIQSGTLPSDVTSLDFTLTYNDDLLSFVRVDEPSVDTIGYYRSPDGLAHLTFRVSPVGNDSIVATLHFYPYVARATQTAIVIGSPSLSNASGNPEGCIDSITTGQTLFTLIPACGTNDLSNFLRNGTVLINNIAPNPASGMITVGIASIVGDASGASVITSAELSIIDELGRTVCRQNVVFPGGGEDQFQMNIEDLPSGIYAVQLRGVGIISTREFIKE
jgi:photosystem II stability/assembly factor-like uncharacterized protein